MPNRPATNSAWTALAPETFRLRKMRSGTSGVRAVASRAMKPASSAIEAGAEPQRQRGTPAVIGRGLDDRVDAEHQGGGDQDGPKGIRAVLQADSLVPLDHADGGKCRHERRSAG